MLHPYSIFFRAMWETPRAADDVQVADRTRPLRWALWWRDTARRRAGATDAAAPIPTAVTAQPTEAPGEGIAT